jgi:hypothetical protein
MSLKKQQGKKAPLFLPEMRSAATTPRSDKQTSPKDIAEQRSGVSSSMSSHFNAGYPQPQQQQQQPLLSHRRITGDTALARLKPFVLNEIASSRVPFKNKSNRN